VNSSDPTPPGYVHLFSPGRIGSLELRNRIVMTPMGTNQERSDGHLGEGIIRYYEERARGGVGLVIAGVASIMWPQGASNPNQSAISDDAFLPDWRELARRVHAQGARLAVQLHHGSKVAVQDIAAGRPLWVPSKRPLKAGDLYDHLTPEELRDATSALMQPGAAFALHEMTRSDIAHVIGRYADAAARAKQAGVDAVELHAGHGYMLAAFLSPASNLREDDYGGPLENRARMLTETIAAVRERVGVDYPLWCRIDGTEFAIEGGIDRHDAVRTAELAAAAGVDAVHVSAYADPTSAAAFTVAPLVHEPAAYLPLAAAVKARVDVPVIAVGRIEPERAERALAGGEADFIAMGRKLLADPELPAKLAAGAAASVRPCVYSYSCVGNVFLRRASRCTVNAWMGREGDAQLRVERAATPREIVVVGGGPAGLEAARVAAARGHDVTLYERSTQLGGLANTAALISDDTRRWVDYLVGCVEAADIRVCLDTPVDAEMLERLRPQAAVIAVGGLRRRAPYVRTGAGEGPRIVGVAELAEFLGEDLTGRRIAVDGDDMIALSVAEHLAGAGAAVSLIGRGEHWAPEMAVPRRWRLLDRLKKAGATFHCASAVVCVSDSGALVAAVETLEQGREVEPSANVEADTMVVVERAEPSPLAAAMRTVTDEVYVVGDANGPRYLQDGLLEAVRVAVSL